METKDYIDVADVIFNELLDVLQRQIEANEQCETFGKPPLPHSINIKDFLTKTTENAREVHANAVYYGKDTHGTATDWENKAQGRFRDNLLRLVRMEKDFTLKEHLQSQIFELWPQLIPLRSLNSEEMAGLCELQHQADILIDNLRQSTNDAIEGLWAIATAEKMLISSTNANNQRLIHDRTRCELAAIGAIVSTAWNRQTSNLAEPPAQITKYYMAAAPCRWADKNSGMKLRANDTTQMKHKL